MPKNWKNPEKYAVFGLNGRIYHTTNSSSRGAFYAINVGRLHRPVYEVDNYWNSHREEDCVLSRQELRKINREKSKKDYMSSVKKIEKYLKENVPQWEKDRRERLLYKWWLNAEVSDAGDFDERRMFLSSYFSKMPKERKKFLLDSNYNTKKQDKKSDNQLSLF